MRHRLEKLEFFENKHSRAIPDEGSNWRVCQDYEVIWSSESIEDARLYPKYPWKQKDKWNRYKPLQDKPDLFLKFAQLHKERRSIELVLDWTRRYGLLGYVPEGYPDWEEVDDKRRASWEVFRRIPRARHNLRDGAVSVFWEEVERAAGVLAMYEAALEGDNEAARTRLLEESPFLGGRVWWPVARHLDRFEEDRDLEASGVVDWVEDGLQGNYLHYCLWTAALVVQGTVHDYCYPMLHFGVEDKDERPSDIVDTWGFDNLLGAMYLQMFWLMGSGANTTRCKWCGRLISLESPFPGAKKRPSHKRFCDRYCRQKWHYRHRVKIRRRGEEPVD